MINAVIAFTFLEEKISFVYCTNISIKITLRQEEEIEK